MEDKEIKEISEIKANIKKYIISSEKCNLEENNLEIELIQIGGFSNMNYKAIIKNTITGDIIEQIFYRKFCSKFASLSDSINHELESKITKYLAEKGYGPKLLYEDSNNYTISEFLVDTITLPLEKCFDQNILEQLISILNYFTLFSNSYNFKINEKDNVLNLIKNNSNEKDIYFNKNQFQKSFDIYEKTKSSFKVFVDEFKQKYSEEKNPKEWADVGLVQNYLDNFRNYFYLNYPSKGFLVLNHNDVFRFNILLREKENKIFLIDHEYFSLNLPGYDIAYYFIEYYITYEPEYFCDFEAIDFEKLFYFYEKFILKFINEHDYLEKEEEGKNFIELIKTKKYFIQLINAINLYMFVWSIGNVDFKKWEKEPKKEFFFVHGVDRIKFYLKGMDIINHLK